MVAERSMCWGLWVVGVFEVAEVFDVFACLISMALDEELLGLTWMDAMALRSCSTAVTIVVFS